MKLRQRRAIERERIPDREKERKYLKRTLGYKEREREEQQEGDEKREWDGFSKRDVMH